MTQPAKSNEPSMEEILASIRRIIADDDATKSVPPVEAPKPAAPAVRPAVPPPRMPSAPPRVSPPAVSPVEAPAAAEKPGFDEPSTDILELTESMAAPAPAGSAPGFRTIDGGSDVEFDEPVETPAPQAPASATARLLSRSATDAVDSAFNTLAQSVLVQNAKTLEDLVREMLRPMLKAWLDENLPGMVERMVRAEIERVSRGR